MSQRSLSVVLASLLACAWGCRAPQASGERRVTPDASYQDSALGGSATSCVQVECKAPAECKLNAGRATCVCPSGYVNAEDDARACQDVDECASGEFDCDPNATCVNRPGAYECTCKQGWKGNGKLCTSLDECQGATNTCHADAMCSPEGDGVRCECVGGFRGDGKLCVDIDECEEGTKKCADHATCQNVRGNAICACEPLFEGKEPDTECRNSCTVALENSATCDPGGHGRCAFSADGSAKCTSCESGYLGDGKRCNANSECAALGCGENTVCAGMPGARSCACAPGYRGDPKTGCTDIDECADGQVTDDCDDTKTECKNADGGYVCACKQGLERVGDKCVNIDECTYATDLCDAAASCTDLPVGYTCGPCKSGYRGDGRACQDIDECAEKTADCAEDGVATCQNTRGGYECVCPKGYAGGRAGESCYCDLSGYWAVRQKATLELRERSAGNVVLLEATTTRATIWELHRYTYDGSTIVVEKKQCGSDRAAELFSPLYHETYSSFVPNSVYDGLSYQRTTDVPMSKSAALPGKTFVTPREALVQGIKLKDPVNDPWPKSHRDIPESQWEDPDNDGEPGLTLWPGQTTKMTRDGRGTFDYLPVELQGDSTRIATRAGCVSTAVRAVGHLEGSITSCSRLVGKVINDKTEGRVHGCTLLRMADWTQLDVTCRRADWDEARPCNDDQIEFLDDQDQSSKASADFESVKLGGLDANNIDCNTVREALPAL